MMMFLIKLLSIIVFDLCTNICCIYSVCKNCCKDDAIKETNLRNENFLKLIEFKDDGKVYYNGLSQCFDQIDRDQVEGIVNPEYSETVFFYGINKELYNSITRKSYIKFYGIKNIEKYKKRSVKKNGIDQYAEEKDKNRNNKDIKKDIDEIEITENKNKNENKIKTFVKVEKEDEVNSNNIENENETQNKDNHNQKNQANDIGETEEDNCFEIHLYDALFENCDVVNMDKFVLFAVKTQGGNCYLGFCRDGNSKEIVNEDGSKDIVGLFKGSKKNVEVKMISCGEKLENVQYMFSDNLNLKNIVFTPLFVPLSVTSMCYMFAGCSELNELDLFNFNSASTSEKNQIDMCYMFFECRKLEKLTFPYFDNDKFNLICSRMFIGCTNLRKCNLMVDNYKIIADFERWKPENIKLEEETKKGDKEITSKEENKGIISKEENDKNEEDTSKNKDEKK